VNAFVLAEAKKTRVRVMRMEFALIHGRADTRVLKKLFEMRFVVIRHADRAQFALT
jgi:hypothetical protein